jgi:hypothetical protein
MKFRILIILLIFSLVFVPTSSLAAVPGQDFPYAKIQLLSPPLENPCPGFGNYYSAYSRGVDSLMWNPALLSRIKHADGSLSLVSGSPPSDYNYKYEVEDKSFKLDDAGLMNVGFFLTSDRNVTTQATREHTAHNIYSTQGTGMNFKQALKVNDWLSLGVISRSEAGASIDMSGNMAAINSFNANFKNSNISLGNTLSVGIDNSGYATVTVTPEVGVTYTQRLDQKVWDGFLTQRSVVPYTAVLEARNDVSFSAPLTLGGAAKWRDLSVGLNFTPMSANCNINNSARAVVNSGTPDMVFYQPNIDPKNEQSILNWMQDPNQYGTELGYKRNTIHVPAGEVIGEARYKGFYQASASRMDLGATYDFGENITVALAFENLSGATFNFRGQGITSYVNSRIGSLEAPSIDSTKTITWTPFKDTFSTVEGTEKFYLEEQLSAELPRKTHLGVALRKPFLIALDYEMNSTPIKVKYEDKTTKLTKLGTISNITMLRLGTETQLFSLPCWLRGSTILMFKPTLSNFDQDTMDGVDKFFKFGVLPVALELGTEFNFWGVIVGDGLGLNLTPLISAAQADAVNLDFAKVIYYDIYLGNGPWRIGYNMAFDPGATASAYGNRADKSKKIENPSDAMTYLRYIQTLKVSYSF